MLVSGFTSNVFVSVKGFKVLGSKFLRLSMGSVVLFMFHLYLKASTTCVSLAQDFSGLRFVESGVVFVLGFLPNAGGCILESRCGRLRR